METDAAVCRGGRCGKPFRTTEKCYSMRNENICVRNSLITTRHDKIYGKIKTGHGISTISYPKTGYTDIEVIDRHTPIIARFGRITMEIWPPYPSG